MLFHGRRRGETRGPEGKGNIRKGLPRAPGSAGKRSGEGLGGPPRYPWHGLSHLLRLTAGRQPVPGSRGDRPGTPALLSGHTEVLIPQRDPDPLTSLNLHFLGGDDLLAVARHLGPER